jgi:hypothetical protein
VAADELTISCESDIAFDDACPHPNRSEVGLAAVFWELERGTAMADRELRGTKGAGSASVEFFPQGSVGEAIE